MAPASVPDVSAAAELVRTQLGLRLGAGVVVCVPVPSADALPEAAAREAVSRAIREAEEVAVGGPALTPWLLARIANLTQGASTRANTSLIVNDARVAGELAVLLTAT
jgi:pseudouridine-5'-phosphate glycosidase